MTIRERFFYWRMRTRVRVNRWIYRHSDNTDRYPVHE